MEIWFMEVYDRHWADFYFLEGEEAWKIIWDKQDDSYLALQIVTADYVRKHGVLECVVSDD